MGSGVVAGLMAVGRGERDAALAALAGLDSATGAGSGTAAGPEYPRVAQHLRRYLDGDVAGAVYDSAEPLTRFIDGASNVALYDALHTTLAHRAAARAPRTLLDLGCGDGRVVAATIAPTVTTVDLVEPSEALLALAVERLATAGRTVRPHPTTAAAFLAATSDAWDLAESTFALHTMTADERAPVLAALRDRVGRLVLAEFDVPAFADRSPEHAVYVAERYERGLAEYDGDDVVAQGFLMPVLVGQFDPAAPRHTHEQPASAWVGELHAAGFTDVSVHTIHPYWWADAVLIDAGA